MGFIEQHQLWDDAQRSSARSLRKDLESKGVEVVRLGFADQHGIVRGKTIALPELEAALKDGYRITTTLLMKDTSHRTVFPVFSAGGGFGMSQMQGAGDMVMVPDPRTARILPWAPHSGWLLCDLVFQDGTPVPFSTRRLFRRALSELAEAGYDFLAGLEIEFHLFKLDDAKLDVADSGQPGQPGKPPEVSLLTHGYQYLTELRYDLYDPALELLRDGLVKLGLPLRSLEVEFGPSQCELTFSARTGLEAADMMVLLRGAVKQIARRNGYHATFMCRPRLPNMMSSGWHLHESLVDRSNGSNAFAAAPRGDAPLSSVGMHFLGGLLAHAAGAAAFSTPTINGYRRFRPNSLAPDRAAWGIDNKAAMIRVSGLPGDPATHLENRVGEPAANPYLYMAAQIFSGLDGLRLRSDPGPSADAPYESDAPLLPASLAAALASLDADATLRKAFGDAFVDYFIHLKKAEIARFEAEVTAWEQREYFELF